MKKSLKTKLPAKLIRGRKSFESWRRTKKPGTRFPKPLWDLAVNLAREYGVSRTSRILGLDYNYLKRRLGPPVSGDLVPAGSTAPFLELFSAGSNSTVECTVECENINGAKIRIYVKGIAPPDLVTLSSDLWNRVR